MKVYGYNPLDNPLQKCDNIHRLKGQIFSMTLTHNRSGSSTSDWQTLQDHCKADKRRETRDAFYVSRLSSFPLVSCLPSPALVRTLLSRVLFLMLLTFLYYIVRHDPLFISSLYIKYVIAKPPEVCYNTRRHDAEKALSIGPIKSCELKHVQGR